MGMDGLEWYKISVRKTLSPNPEFYKKVSRFSSKKYLRYEIYTRKRWLSWLARSPKK